MSSILVLSYNFRSGFSTVTSMRFGSGSIEPTVIIESDSELSQNCLQHITELFSCNFVFRTRVLIKRNATTIVYFVSMIGMPRDTFEYIVAMLVTSNVDRCHVCSSSCRPFGYNSVRCLDGFPHRRCGVPVLRRDGTFGLPHSTPFSLTVIADLLFEEEFHPHIIAVADGREGRRLFARMMNK